VNHKQSAHKQHIVPKLYLRRFARDGQLLLAYDKATGKTFRVSVEDAAQKHGFFSLPQVDGAEGSGSFAESYFQHYEGPAAGAIQAVVDSLHFGVLAPISPEVRGILARFAAVQYLRTQITRQIIIDINRIMNQMADEWPDVPELQHGRTVLEGKELAMHHLSQALKPESVLSLADILYSHVWGVMINRTSAPFYTSDHPVTLHCHEDRPNRGVGPATFGAEVAIPLAPHCLLVLLEREFATQFAPFVVPLDGCIWGAHTEENATFYRSLQVRDSYRFVYSPRDNDFALADEMCNTHPEFRDPDHPRMSAMAGGDLIYGLGP
jgi:hypothetical protein